MTESKSILPVTGILVADLSGRSGGKTRRTREVARAEINAGAGVRRDLETIVTVADREEDGEGQAIEQMIVAGLRRGVGTLTPFGWIVSPDRLPELDALIERARKRAEEFHERAKHVRVHVGVARGTFDLTQPEVVASIGNKIEADLREIRTLIRAGMISAGDSPKGEASAESAIRFADQIPSLLIGQGRHVARLAIEEARSLMAQVKREAKERNVSREVAARGIVTPLLDAAISLVSPDGGGDDQNSDPMAGATIGGGVGADDADALAGLL